MDCQNEDYQLLLNNIVQLLKTDWKLAVVLIKGQSITADVIPLEGIVEDIINGEFIINGLTILSHSEKDITIRGGDQFNGRGFDKTAKNRHRVGHFSRVYKIHDFKYRITNYLYQNLKNTMDESIK